MLPSIPCFLPFQIVPSPLGIKINNKNNGIKNNHSLCPKRVSRQLSKNGSENAPLLCFTHPLFRDRNHPYLSQCDQNESSLYFLLGFNANPFVSVHQKKLWKYLTFASFLRFAVFPTFFAFPALTKMCPDESEEKLHKSPDGF